MVETKVLLVTGPSGLVEVPLPSIHSREGENRTETAALMIAVEAQEEELSQQRGRQKQTIVRRWNRIIESIRYGSRRSNNRWWSVFAVVGVFHGRDALPQCVWEKPGHRIVQHVQMCAFSTYFEACLSRSFHSCRTEVLGWSSTD